MMASAASNDSMGCVLILSNPCGEEGTNLHEQYSRRMEKLWTGKLGCELFENTVHSDLSAEAVMDVFERLASKDASSYQYLIVVVICNGGLMETHRGIWHPFIEAKDGKYVQEDAFVSKFYNNNQEWREKPKLFILGYNRIAKMEPRFRGDEPRKPFPWRPGKNSSLNDDEFTDDTCSMFSDLLMLYGSSSVLMEEVYTAFSTRFTSDTFTQMLTRVNRQMTKGGKWSVFESTITSPCTIFPPRNQDTIRDASEISSSSVNDIVNRVMMETVSTRERFGTSITGDNIRAILDHALSSVPQNITVAEVRNAICQPPISRNSSKTPLKGRGVVISNCLEKEKKSKCHITDKDKMESLWRGTLGCEMETHLDKTASDMKETIKNLALSDSEGYDYLVVVISSHGGLKKMDNGDILRPVCFGVHGHPVCEREILSYFEGENSPWHDKVKLFILDYCRGDKEELRVPKVGTAYPDIEYHHDEKIFHTGTLPMINNCVVLYATYCDHLAYSNDLIPTVADIFTENWDHKSLTEMLVMVNASMRDVKDPKEEKAMSVFKSTLGTEFYLYKKNETGMDNS